MLELGIRFFDPAIEHSNCVFDHFSPKKGSGYKGVAKVLWNLMKQNPKHNIWVYTKVYAKKNGRWIYFMEFEDVLYHQKGYVGRRMFSTRKGVQKYLRHLRGCVKTALKEEVPERLDIADKFSVVYLD